MGLSMMLLIGCLGLGAVGAVVAVVVVIATSRREDFVNPFGGKSELSMMQPLSASATKSVPVIPPQAAPDTVPDSVPALVQWLIAKASEQTGVNLTGDMMVKERMTNAVRLALQGLDEQDSYKISMPFLTADANGPKHFEFTLTRQMTEKIQ